MTALMGIYGLPQNFISLFQGLVCSTDPGNDMQCRFPVSMEYTLILNSVYIINAVEGHMQYSADMMGGWRLR